MFTYLVQNEHLPVGLAFVIAVVVLAPAVGLVFDRFLFRKIAPANVIAKLVTGISMLIGIPAILSILFTNSNQYNPPSILFNPDVVYFRIAGTPINGISVTCVLATAVTLIALVVLIRWTSLGLKMRGAVESRRLIELDGVNGGRVVASAWAVSGLIAGLAGVLLAPIYGQLQFSDYADLMVAAFAAAAWAVLRSLPIAVLVGILMGMTVTILQGYLPAGSIWSSAALTSLPFIVLVGALRPGARDADARRGEGPAGLRRPAHASDHRHPAGPRVRPGDQDPLVRAPGGVLGVHAHLDAQDLGERLQRRSRLLGGVPVDHPHHRDGGPAVPVPGHPGRGRGLHGRASWPATSA